MRAMDFTLNNMTLLGADARRRHRHRRCDRGAGEHLPLRRREGPHAVRRGDRGHARGGAAGDGDHAVADRDLPAGGVHDRLRAPLHLPVRLDDGVCDPGLDDRQLYADADAQLALAEDLRAARRARRPSTTGCFAPWIGATPRRCAGRSRIRWRLSASRPPWSR